MADQNHNQSNQNPSPGQQSSPRDTERDIEQSPDSDRTAGGKQSFRDDESRGMGPSERERSTREPASTASDRGMGDREERRLPETDELEGEADVDADVSDIDDEDIGGESNR